MSRLLCVDDRPDGLDPRGVERRQPDRHAEKVRHPAVQPGIDADPRMHADLEWGAQLVDRWRQPGVDADHLLQAALRAAQAIERHGSGDQVALAQFVDVGARRQRDPAGQPLQELARRAQAIVHIQPWPRVEVALDAGPRRATGLGGRDSIQDLLDARAFDIPQAGEHLLESQQEAPQERRRRRALVVLRFRHLKDCRQILQVAAEQARAWIIGRHRRSYPDDNTVTCASTSSSAAMWMLTTRPSSLRVTRASSLRSSTTAPLTSARSFNTSVWIASGVSSLLAVPSGPPCSGCRSCRTTALTARRTAGRSAGAAGTTVTITCTGAKRT